MLFSPLCLDCMAWNPEQEIDFYFLYFGHPKDDEKDKVDDKICDKDCGSVSPPSGTCGKSFDTHATAELHIHSKAANQFYKI
jgi:hypothetical protein